MGKIINLIICLLLGSTFVFAQSDSLAKVYQQRFLELEQSLMDMKNEDVKLKQRIKVQEKNLALQTLAWDSLKSTVSSNAADIKAVAKRLGIKINETNCSLQTKANAADLKSKTQWGGVLLTILFIVFLVTYMLLHKRIKTETSSIDDVRKAQEALQNAQSKMQEESVKLDNQLLNIVQQQLQKMPIVT